MKKIWTIVIILIIIGIISCLTTKAIGADLSSTNSISNVIMLDEIVVCAKRIPPMPAPVYASFDAKHANHMFNKPAPRFRPAPPPPYETY